MLDISIVSPTNYSVILLVTVGTISLFCSMLTLWLIYSMRKFNGYIMLIIQLTISQALYDISIIMIANSANHYVYFSYIGIRCISGLASTFWTNVISFVVFYVVWNLKSFNIMGNFHYLFAIVAIPSVIIGLLVPIYLTSDGLVFYIFSEIYFYLRLLSIVVNVIIYIFLSVKLYQRDVNRLHFAAFMNNPTSFFAPVAEDPISVLTHRMKYYPIVQIITRGAASWFEQEYGYIYSYSNSYNLSEKISLLTYSICLPIAGVGYFIIFTMLSPGAWHHLKSHVVYVFSFGQIELKSSSKSLLSISKRFSSTPSVSLHGAFESHFMDTEEDRTLNSSFNEKIRHGSQSFEGISSHSPFFHGRPTNDRDGESSSGNTSGTGVFTTDVDVGMDTHLAADVSSRQVSKAAKSNPPTNYLDFDEDQLDKAVETLAAPARTNSTCVDSHL